MFCQKKNRNKRTVVGRNSCATVLFLLDYLRRKGIINVIGRGGFAMELLTKASFNGEVSEREKQNLEVAYFP